ncbi:MAG: transposase [Anaerolineae bacterium]|nr:transposase [Anaerolineae bacterium]
MSLRKLYHWVDKTSKDWQGVTRHFKQNVVIFSRAVVLAQSSHLRALAGVAGGRAESQRRRLQRFVAGQQPLAAFFANWTRSVVGVLKQRPVVLVVDETKLLALWGVMVVGVAYGQRCIPLAWRVYRANSAQDYPSEGQVPMILTLLRQVQAGLPARCRVRVLADRGIGTSPTLMRGIAALGWTFLFRVTKQSKIVLPAGQEVTFYDQVTQPGGSYQASGQVFKKRGQVSAHVRVLWAPSAQEPWALVTNDPALTGWEYAQRMWIEEAFRDLKSHGWQVEDAALTDPQRMAHLWIFLVVAYGWMLLFGAELAALGQTALPRRRADGSSVRRWSLFREGRQAFLSATFCSSA